MHKPYVNTIIKKQNARKNVGTQLFAMQLKADLQYLKIVIWYFRVQWTSHLHEMKHLNVHSEISGSVLLTTHLPPMEGSLEGGHPARRVGTGGGSPVATAIKSHWGTRGREGGGR